eukprot:5966714-Pleurochrysis_carterae.AAC.5
MTATAATHIFSVDPRLAPRRGGASSAISRKNRLQRCSICGGLGHKSRTCELGHGKVSAQLSMHELRKNELRTSEYRGTELHKPEVHVAERRHSAPFFNNFGGGDFFGNDLRGSELRACESVDGESQSSDVSFTDAAVDEHRSGDSRTVVA